MKWYWIGEKLVEKFPPKLKEGEWFLTKEFIDSLSAEQKALLIKGHSTAEAKGYTVSIIFLIIAIALIICLGIGGLI